MWAGVLLAAVAHLPRFPGDLQHRAEPSLASYNTHAATYTVTYEPGDFMYFVVYRPETLGFQYTLDSAPRYSAELSGDCAYGDPATNAHATYKAAGETSYEPFGESSLTVVATVLANHTSAVHQVCAVTIRLSHSQLPYVVVTGTKEEVLEVFAVGLPFYVAHISLWVGNFVYPIILLGAVAVALIAGVTSLRTIAALSLLTTAANRLAQAAVAGWGAGQLFALIPAATAGGVLVATQFRWRLLTVAMAWLAPTHWWVDAALVTAALLVQPRAT
jgi:hypothetical protein